MRTTIDIPEPLFRDLKIAAASQGETLRSFLLRAARMELARPTETQGSRVRLPLVESREASYDLSPERLNRVLEAEDHDLAGGR